ncbi:MAG TPA: DsbA family oxidoreductase [Stellaceae bacterium]|jgi:predicted DsbA family dithiol-disulfide isomerase
MRIDIVSDVICPWCYIGKRRLDRALRARPAVAASATLSWRAFQLNPEMPASGISRDAYLSAKFGNAGHARRAYASVAEAGAAEGIEFDFDRIRRTPNTRDAHRLIRYAARRGRAEPTVEALFRAYFRDGRDIGDRAALIEIADEVGFEPAHAADYLASGDGLDDVLSEDRSARRLGINAVPCFIIDGGYAISGAQEPEFFLPLFDLALNAPMAVEE